MNVSRKTTDKKVKVIVNLLANGLNNEDIRQQLAITFDGLYIGKNYVQSVRKTWKDCGMTEDWKTVRDAMIAANMERHGKERSEAVPAPAEVKEEAPAVEAPRQERVVQGELFEPELTRHEILVLKSLVRFIDKGGEK